MTWSKLVLRFRAFMTSSMRSSGVAGNFAGLMDAEEGCMREADHRRDCTIKYTPHTAKYEYRTGGGTSSLGTCSRNPSADWRTNERPIMPREALHAPRRPRMRLH